MSSLLFDVSCLNNQLTGVERYTLELASALPKLFPNVTFINHQGSLDASAIEASCTAQPNNRLKNLLKKKLPFNAQLGKHYREYRLKNLGKLINQFSSENSVLYHNPYFVLPQNIKVPGIVTVHDLSHLDIPEYQSKATIDYLDKYLAMSLDKAKHIITVSEFTRGRVLDEFKLSPQKVTCIPNGVSKKFYPISADLCQNVLEKYGLTHKQFLLSVGTIEPRKNLASLLKAYSRLPLAIKNRYPLVLVGKQGWKSEPLMRQINKMLEQENVLYLGHINEDELTQLYASAKVFAYLSLYEGFGLPVLEALASGTMVIASKQDALIEVMGEVGYHADADNVSDILHKLEQALVSVQTLEETKKYQLQAKKFSWEACAEKTAELYRDSLKPHSYTGKE